MGEVTREIDNFGVLMNNHESEIFCLNPQYSTTLVKENNEKIWFSGNKRVCFKGKF